MNIVIHTDGGARGNPGKAAIGVAVFVGDECVYELASFIGVATNNEAEYQALIAALEWLLVNQENLQAKAAALVVLKLDSKLVVEQVNKNWKIKEARLRALAEKCWALLEEITLPTRITHVLRAENFAADALVNQALDAQAE